MSVGKTAVRRILQETMGQGSVFGACYAIMAPDEKQKIVNEEIFPDTPLSCLPETQNAFCFANRA
jgi:hypothetical protein